jgi:tRNA(Ile)-lysidine synthase TilS/MesJ
LIEEKEVAQYAQMSGYEKQVKLCPFEKETSRAQVKALIQQLEALNPNVRDSLWGAMENIKEDYLPKRIEKH